MTSVSKVSNLLNSKTGLEKQPYKPSLLVLQD
jgi:hypothetical protein